MYLAQGHNIVHEVGIESGPLGLESDGVPPGPLPLSEMTEIIDETHRNHHDSQDVS